MEIDFQTDIILIADDFYDSYRRCCEGRNPTRTNNGIKYSTCNVPAVVNGAFAIELYFKSMLQIEIRKHELKILFDNLTTDIKLEIRDAVSPRLANIGWNKSLEEYLEDINISFEEWRYIYEAPYSEKEKLNKLNEYLTILQIIIPQIKDIAHKHNSTK